MFFHKKKVDKKWLAENVVKATEFYEKYKDDGRKVSVKNEETVRFSLKAGETYIQAFKDFEKTLERERKVREQETFSEKVEHFLTSKGMKSVKFYKAADIDRKVYSAMKNNKSYQPKKETALACCLGLGLDIEESEELLKSAGFALSDSIKRDAVVKYCILHGICDVNMVNELLDACGEKTLRNI